MDTEPGPLVGRGRAADVYVYGDGLVLRRYRTPHDCLYEAAVMQHVHAQGYPCPAVVEVAGGDIVMERLDGPTMLASLSSKPWRVGSYARKLAVLHRRLEQVLAPDWMPAPFGEGDRVVHLDLHPDNVMLTSRGPVVIDWTNAKRGPVGAETAHTWVLLASAQPPTGWQRVLVTLLRKLFLRAFLRGLDTDAAQPFIVPMAEHRLRDRNMRPPELRAFERIVATGRV